jgi:nuclear transport factor 2 (NTF2) superfamily protein
VQLLPLGTPSLADHVARVDADDVAAARSSEASDTNTAALLSFRREASINDRAICIDQRRVVWHCSPEDLR